MKEVVKKYESVLTVVSNEAKKSFFSKIGDKMKGNYNVYTDNIPDEKKSKILKEHDIGIRTNVLLIVENDRVGSDDGSFVVTSTFISIFQLDGFLSDWDNVKLKIPFENIISIEKHSDKVFIKTNYTNNLEFELPLNIVIQSDVDMNKPKIPALFELLKELVNLIENIDLSSIDSIEKFNHYEKTSSIPNYKPFLTVANLLIDEGTFEDAEELIEKAKEHLSFQIGKWDEQEKSKLIKEYWLKSIEDIEIIESKFFHRIGKPYNGLCKLNQIFSNINPNSIELKRAFNNHKFEFKKDFFKISENNRKVLVFSKEIPVSVPDSFIQITEEIIPNDLKFPLSHPQIDETYLKHPHKEDFYLPYGEFEEFLAKEKLNELFTLLRCLGAEKIFYRSNSSFVDESAMETIKSKGAEVHTPKGSIGAEVSNSNKQKESTSVKEELRKEIKYKPLKEPYMPEDLFWFDYEPDWQRIAKDRIEGNMEHEKISFKSEKSAVLSKGESHKLSVSLSAPNVPIGVKKSFEAVNNSKSSSEESILVDLEVFFKKKPKNKLEALINKIV